MDNEQFKQNVELIPQKAHEFLIGNDEEYQQAGEFLIAIKKLNKEINETFDPIIKKAHDSHKEALKQKSKFTDPLKEASAIINPKIANYQLELERAKKEEQERLQREENKKYEERLLRRAEAAEKEGTTADVDEILEESDDAPVVVKAPERPKVAGISKTIMTWKWRVKKPDAIDRKFMAIDQVKINSIVRSLGKNAESIVGGIEVFQVSSVRSTGR